MNIVCNHEPFRSRHLQAKTTKPLLTTTTYLRGFGMQAERSPILSGASSETSKGMVRKTTFFAKKRLHPTVSFEASALSINTRKSFKIAIKFLNFQNQFSSIFQLNSFSQRKLLCPVKTNNHKKAILKKSISLCFRRNRRSCLSALLLDGRR